MMRSDFLQLISALKRRKFNSEMVLKKVSADHATDTLSFNP